jgi:tripeptide aminopeptidase
MTRVAILSSVLMVALSLMSGAQAQSPVVVGPAIEMAFEMILADPRVVKALDDIKADDARTFEEQKRITEVPAPPFKEGARAAYYLKRFRDLGFEDAFIDAEGNVIGMRRGSAGTPKLVISAHLVHRVS